VIELINGSQPVIWLWAWILTTLLQLIRL